MTGFPADAGVAAFAGSGGCVVQKPFRASVLLERARGLLTS
jgi:hypothetical protein